MLLFCVLQVVLKRKCRSNASLYYILLLTDVPELLDIDNHAFNLECSKSFSGGLFITANNGPYVTLENAFNETFVASDYKSCLLTIGMNTVAILMPFPDVFKIFDSHSRNLHVHLVI